ncbi:thiol peroxidase [Propioniciclava coleopterorum]|uniref:Thiol peroxidase n=1 Tax=Propioniciclava coleopterorum TaxID=2714937 RepID=A0A6G7Y9N4_9ACTN|nr:thiol peroxidase [Propioniciclava coleopterorum]QIK73358.1 thiol peroxidase [Propioniciclava coleopterorum]
MADTKFKGTPVRTVGDLPEVGQSAPDFTLTGADLSDVKLADLAGQRVVLNIFPSVDTGVCAMSVRRFNEIAAGLENTTVVCASADLPFALGRFCGAEGIENVRVGSTFRSSFSRDYGTLMVDGPLAGLNARSVIVLDADGKVVYTEVVPEITQEPDYDAAVAALS